MNTAGSKQSRKPAAKQHDPAPTGTALPVSGNQPPPNAPPTASGTAAAAPGAAPAAGSAAAGPATAAPNSLNADPAPRVPVATPPITDAAAEELAAAAFPSAADSRNVPPAPGNVAAGAEPSIPLAATIQTPPTAAPVQGVPPAGTPVIAKGPPSAAAVSEPKISDGAASNAAIAAATSAPTSTNSSATPNAQAQAGAASAADTQAAAQAAMAAAIAQGTSAPAPDSSASSDDLATPDTGVTLQDVAATNDAAAPLPTALAAHASPAPTSASVTAATAAAIVQAVSASADSGATDKHAHDNGPDGSVGAAQLLTTNAASDTATSPTPTFKVSAGVDTADFGQGVADRVSLMMDGNLTSAKLQVNPPALGPIEVRIALQGGHAQVWMSSHSAVTRDALEATSPKLREMLGSQGFAQVSVDISQRSFQERTPQPKGYESVSASASGSAVPAQASVSAARSLNGLLDAYA
jgi:flagellar hook-length control protein FliK